MFAQRMSPELPIQMVDPRRINLVYTGDIPAMMRRRGEQLEGDWDLETRKTFIELEPYRGLRQRFIEGLAWDETDYYRFGQYRVRRDIERGKVEEDEAESELSSRLEELDALYKSISEDGYLDQPKLSETGQSKQASDEIRVAIRRDGRYLFVDGRHRLAMARLLGLERVPALIVARHPEWDEFRAKLPEKRINGRVYQQIDHPDLSDIPAQHSNDRLPLVVKAFDGYDPHGKRLVEIGAYWGYWSQQLSRVGFQCTAIEAMGKHARIAERLRVATETSFELWRGDVFDFPGIESYDVVFALNIFHHLIKTEERYERLLALLDRMNPEIMIFQAHNPGGAQMKDSYRNYRPKEFAEFVAEQANLPTIEPLGQANDRRPLFKLTR